MKKELTTLGFTASLMSAAFAGSVMIEPSAPCPTSCGGFDKAIRPITNPTLFDLAVPSTNIHPIFIYQHLPSHVRTALSPNTAIDGDAQVYALQFEIALNDRLSIVATKDGYVDFNPDAVLSKETGFGNLAAGLKYAFILNEASGTAVSGTVTFELPTGNSDVFQGEGDGAVNLILSGLKVQDNWQLAGAAGLAIPFSDEQSTMGWMSAHASYQVCQYFIPLVEVNWFHVLDAGNGTGNYPDQVGGLVPAVVAFEGGDYFNIGAVNSSMNRDLVTAAVGFRSRITDNVDVGAAYEIPLTADEKGLLEDRITLDLIWNF